MHRQVWFHVTLEWNPGTHHARQALYPLSHIPSQPKHPSCPCDALEAMLLICPSPAALALHAWTNSICSAPQSQALRPQGLATFWIDHLLFSYSLLNAGSFLLNQKSFSRKPSPHCLNHPLRPL